jgi:hypothetical protein
MKIETVQRGARPSDMKDNPHRKGMGSDDTQEKAEYLAGSVEEFGLLPGVLITEGMDSHGKSVLQVVYGHGRRDAVEEAGDEWHMWACSAKPLPEILKIRLLAVENAKWASVEERTRTCEYALNWLTTHPEDCRRLGINAKRHEGKCTAECISVLFLRRGYSRRWISKLFSEANPGETTSPTRATAPEQTHAYSETDVSTIPTSLPTAASVIKAEETPMATTALAQEIKRMVAEDDELIRNGQQPLSPPTTKDKPSSSAKTEQPPTNGTGEIAKSMARLETIFVRKRGVLRSTFVREVEAYLDQGSTGG